MAQQRRNAESFAARVRRRNTANTAERNLGVRGPVTAPISDMFTNFAARQGYGTPSLGQGASYELVRISYDYWQLITLFRNHWVSRRIVEVPAQDMVKAWPKLTSDIEPKDVTRIDRVLRKTNTKNNILTALTWARLFGGAGALMAVKGQENELDQPLDLDSVGIGAFQGVIPFDRWAGISPLGDICTDISRPLDFNKPEMYEVRVSGGDSFRVHSSRLLRFLGPTVPTPELEAQSYWGISVLEPVYESITKLDNMSWNILGLTFRANLLGMKFPQLAQLLSGLGSSQQASQGFEERMAAINHLVSNQSLIPLPADGSIESTSYSFGGLDAIFQLFQLDLSGAAQIPITRLFGRTYSGLGQTGDGDERIYEEKISTDQASYLLPQLEKLYPVLCMSELGEVPEDLDLVCPSIRVLDEKEKAELAKSVTDSVTVCVNLGVMSPRCAAEEIKQSSDVTGFGTNLTDERIAKLSDDTQSEGELGEDLFGGEGAGLNEAGSPAKAIKSENEAGKSESQEGEKASPEKDALSKAGKAADAAPAMDALPKNLKIGEAILVNGKLLKVAKVTEGTEDLFGEPTVQVQFTTGEVVAYRPDDDVKPKAWDARFGTRMPRRAVTDEDGASSQTQSTIDLMLYHALPVRIESRKGDARGGVTDDGKSWRTIMPADYGFIENVPAADGDNLDCYVGPHPESGNVFVVDQYDVRGKKFDEHKVVLGHHTADSAKEDYMAGHHLSDKTFASITAFTMPMFRRWMATADLSKPCDPSVRV